tara:strand:- start:6268 stop:7203 length:936 start_codon:yes stop_codon:yes gene_type:complete
MACTDCGSSIDISAIRGTAGAAGTNGSAGATGNGITSIVVHPSIADTWLITYTDGTTTNIAAPGGTGGGSGTETHWAWADNASGTGFTLTPSDKSHLAITNTVATSGSPIASDFTSKWFMINQAVTEYNAAKWIDYTMVIAGSTGGTITFSPVPATISSVPVAFFDSVGSYIEFETTFDVRHYNTSFGSGVWISGLLNGTVVLPTSFLSSSIDTICASKPGPGATAIRNRVKLHYISSTATDTTLGVVVINENSNNLIDSGQVEIVQNTITITTGTSIDLVFTDFFQDTFTGEIDIIEQKVKAFNPNKTTI